MSESDHRDKSKYAVDLDGDIFGMSSRAAAVKACQENEAGGIVIAPDGTRTRVEHKAGGMVQYAAGGALEDGPS